MSARTNKSNQSVPRTNRRGFLGSLNAAAVLAVGAGVFGKGIAASGLEAAQERSRRGMAPLLIRDISVIATAPAGLRLVVVKVTTSEPGLYGYGCGTFTQRADLVGPAVERYLKPLLTGRPADRIEDTWQACYNSSYWRNGPVLNNAISGVDMALWDIAGRRAGMPVYQLLGGKCREAADCYSHASGAEINETLDSARSLREAGFRHIRLQVGVPGMSGYGAGRGKAAVRSLHSDPVFEPAIYVRRTLDLMEAARKELGGELEILHDVHERIPPTMALQFARDLEKFRLFFLEDPFSPEDISWFRNLRRLTSIPIAMGELFNSPHEWTPLVAEQLIDFVRVHLSQAGGLTPCRKIAGLAELFGVRTAWHGPGDVSPVGHAANLALDLACHNFGIQEAYRFPAAVREVFDGCPEIRDGYMFPTERPGWGIEVDEKLAAKYPFGSLEEGERKELNGGWGIIRRSDGTVIKQ